MFLCLFIYLFVLFCFASFNYGWIHLLQSQNKIGTYRVRIPYQIFTKVDWMLTQFVTRYVHVYRFHSSLTKDTMLVSIACDEHWWVSLQRYQHQFIVTNDAIRSHNLRRLLICYQRYSCCAYLIYLSDSISLHIKTYNLGSYNFIRAMIPRIVRA